VGIENKNGVRRSESGVDIDQPSPKRLESWVHLRTPRVRRPSTPSSPLLTTTQEEDDR
jgi:hypothetical protein